MSLLSGLWGFLDLLTDPFLGSNDDEKGSNKCLFEVGKAETLGDFCDGLGKLGWEVDALILRELRSPVITVLDPLRSCWKGEVILAVKSTWPFRDARIESLQVICAPEHHQAFVGFQSVNFIQEETLDTVCNQTV